MYKQQSFINLATKKDSLFNLGETIEEIVRNETEEKEMKTELHQVVKLGKDDQDVHFLIILNHYPNT